MMPRTKAYFTSFFSLASVDIMCRLAVLDTGCNRDVAGDEIVNGFVELLPQWLKDHVKWDYSRKGNSYGFGGNQSSSVIGTVRLPIAPKGFFGYLEVVVV